MEPISPTNRNSNIDLVNVNIAKPAEKSEISALSQMMNEQDELQK